MTYCLGMLCRTGAVFSPIRARARVWTTSRCGAKCGSSKNRVSESSCIMTSGNLSLTQATLALIDDDLVLANNEPSRETIMNTHTLYETARYVGSKVRAVEKRDRVALEADGFDFNINLIVGRPDRRGSRRRFTRFIRRGTAFMRPAIVRFCRSAKRNTVNRFSIADSITRLH